MSLSHPIRTMEQMNASVSRWEEAMMRSTSSEDPEVVRRANSVMGEEERRINEARPYFEFDPDDDSLLGLSELGAKYSPFSDPPEYHESFA